MKVNVSIVNAVSTAAAAAALCSGIAYVDVQAKAVPREAQATAAWVDLTAVAVAREATATASWLDIQVSAETTRPDILGVDIVTPTDQLSLAAQKILADEAAVAEFMILVTEKAFSDNATPQDVLFYQVSKALEEQAVLSDILALSVIYNREFVDEAAAFDAVSKSAEKGLSSPSLSLADVVALLAEPGYFDTAVVSDVLTVFKNYFREFGDSASASDATSLAAAKELADQAAATDVLARSTAKGLSNTTSITDQIASLDVNKVITDQAYAAEVLTTVVSFVREFYDTASSSDVLIKSTQKGLVDAASVGDSVVFTVIPAGQLNSIVLNGVTLN